MANQNSEEFKVRGEDLLAKVKELIKEGNIRRIIVRNDEGKSLFELSLTMGLVGVILAPSLAALGAIAALVADCTVVIERGSEE